MQEEGKEGGASLRQQAEELLSIRSTKTIAELSEAEIYKLLHELQVHQIELELQNKELILAKEEVEIASEKYIDLYDFSPSGYFTLSRHGEILQLNLTGAKILGKERSQLIRQRFQHFVSKVSQPVFSYFLSSAFGNNTNGSCELSLLTMAGGHRIVHVDGVVTENGENCYITATDITQRKQTESELQLSLEFNQSLLKTIPFGMDIVDENGSILFLSDSFKQRFGEIGIGKKCWEMYRDDQKQCLGCPLHWGIHVGETKKYETSDVLGGKVFEISHTGMIFNGKKALLEIFIDVTERKQAELELISAKEQAQESDRLKSSFLANMSHEIRTPMNGILGFAELLKEPDITNEEQLEFIGIIEKSGLRMLNIINDIISISKIESGLMNVFLSETNINEQIEYLFTFFKPEVQKKGMQLTFRNGLEKKAAIITTDREKVYAILTNLVKNAIKYSDTGSIEFGYDLVGTPCMASLQGNTLQFYVKDTGIGIPKEKHKSIFERFVQADTGNKRAYEGAGLGLAITKAYVEMLGGKIWVESEVRKGSVFYFTLPCIGAVQESNKIHDPIPVHTPEYQIKPLKILIAEDDEVSADFLKLILGKYAKDIILVRNGLDAVETCRKNTDIDLVLMDIKMSGMNGYEAMQEIRKFNKEVIFIVQTAYALVSERRKAISAGCNDYISKPVSRDGLLLLLHKYFGHEPLN
jgi:signal transduction histidine kinase/CheY-like chemotaxis protein